MFWSKNKKNRYTPVYQFCYIKVGFEGVRISRTCFPDEKSIRWLMIIESEIPKLLLEILKVKITNDQEMVQSERNPHSKKPRLEKTELTIRYSYEEIIL